MQRTGGSAVQAEGMAGAKALGWEQVWVFDKQNKGLRPKHSERGKGSRR